MTGKHLRRPRRLSDARQRSSGRSRNATDPRGFIDDFARISEEDWVPANGASVVARAWTDPDFKRRLWRTARPPSPGSG
jgi:hypothetical protein